LSWSCRGLPSGLCITRFRLFGTPAHTLLASPALQQQCARLRPFPLRRACRDSLSAFSLASCRAISFCGREERVKTDTDWSASKGRQTEIGLAKSLQLTTNGQHGASHSQGPMIRSTQPKNDTWAHRLPIWLPLLAQRGMQSAMYSGQGREGPSQAATPYLAGTYHEQFVTVVLGEILFSALSLSLSPPSPTPEHRPPSRRECGRARRQPPVRGAAAPRSDGRAPAGAPAPQGFWTGWWGGGEGGGQRERGAWGGTLSRCVQCPQSTPFSEGRCHTAGGGCGRPWTDSTGAFGMATADSCSLAMRASRSLRARRRAASSWPRTRAHVRDTTHM